MTATARKIPTDPASFLDWEERQRERYELIDGIVRMMSGGTVRHGLIAANTVRALGNALGDGPCRPLGSDVKIVSPSGSVVYPDAFVRCGPVDDTATHVTDPVLVVEVDSPSTKRYNMDFKRWAYQSIPSLRHMLMIAQDRVLVELMTRMDGDRWISTLLRSPGDAIPLESLGITLRVADIYAGVSIKG